MLKKANIQWSGKTLRNQIEKGQVSFDCAVQRNPVWDMSRKSLLIHSMIEGYPIPPFYFARKDNGKYDALDGQQRSLSIKGYLDGEFPLSDDTPQVIDENGFPVTVSGLKFSELPEWAQDNIKDYSLTIYYFEGITEEEIAELFFRINNGKPLTSVELTRVKAKSILKFREIAKHEMIAGAITEAGKRRYNDENVAMQAWALCFSDCRDFTTKGFRPLIESAAVDISVTTKLAPVKPMVTRMAIGKDLRTGKVYAQEYGNTMRGQMEFKPSAQNPAELVVDGKTVDPETGEIKESPVKVLDMRTAKQA